MTDILKLALILFIVAAVAAGGLAAYSLVTKPQIKKINETKEDDAKKYVLQGSTSFIKTKLNDKGEFFFIAKDKNDNLLGYVFKAKKQGFSGIIETMVGVDTDFKIKGLRVLKHTETPGLGAESTVIKYGEKKPYFEVWFEGKNALEVVVEKDNANSVNKVQSLTGATITTRAVCNSINEYSKRVQEKVSTGGKL